MPRRSKRKQNRKKNHKQNPNRKTKYNLEKENLSSKNNLRLNGTTPQTSNVKSSYQNKSLQFELESDSDPDVFYEFQQNAEVNRAKSDSALNRINKYFVKVKSYDSDSTSRGTSDVEKTDILTSNDSCHNTLTESVSTTRTVGSSDIKLINKLKSTTVIQCEMNGYRSSRDPPLALDFIKDLHRKDNKMVHDMHGGTGLLAYNSETAGGKVEKSFENLNQQVMMMKLSEEALELGITTIPPKRLNSSSNIQIKKSCTGTESTSDRVAHSCNNCLSNSSNRALSQENTEEERKIYLEATKNEKHLLNCSLIGEEPQSRSTPILKSCKSKDRRKSSTEANLASCSETTFEEYYTCHKDFIKKDDSQESENCFGHYISCRDIPNKSKEILRIYPPDLENHHFRPEIRTDLKDVSIQCEILKFDIDTADKNEEAEKKCRGDNLDESLQETDQRRRQTGFQTFKRLFTKVSIQKFFHVLSILPIDKIFEFFCLTFSIPLIETMAISISVTKVMNVLSAITLVPNLNEKLKTYRVRAANCLRISWESVSEVFVRYKKNEIDGQTKNSQVCICDIQKMTDLEKRLKNLENELTKFQCVDTEIEKLKEIAKSFQQVRTAAGLQVEAVAAPPLPPPPPPPPPPLPPPTSFGTTLIKPKKAQKPQDTLSRPSITVEDLQKVILRKVTTNERQSQDAKKGPVVSLEMLRSVKLRSSARKKTPTCSPTRTPTSRERIRRIKSPFKSSSRSRDRKSRYPNVPLSEILAMDDSYHLFDQKTAEIHKVDPSICY